MRWNTLLPLLALPLIEAAVSTNSRCGNTNNASPRGMSCVGSRWGNCCSQYGYCGSTTVYCGTGCQSPFGTCSNAASSSVSIRTSTPAAGSSTLSTQTSSAAPSATLKVSSNARCGFLYSALPGGMTCSGSKYGDCCSQYSYCGSTQGHCGAGCQAGFGRCNAVSSSLSSTSRAISSLSSPAQISSRPSSLSTSTSSTTSTRSSSSSASISSTISTGPSLSSTSTLSTTSTRPSSSSASTSSATSTGASSSSASTSTPDSISSSALSSSSDTSTSMSTPSPSSSSSTTSSTTSAASVTPSEISICGSDGDLKSDYESPGSTPFTTLPACLEFCQQDSACRGFAVSKGICYKMDASVTSDQIVLMPGYGYFLYALSCRFDQTPTITPTPIMTSTPLASSMMSSTVASSSCVPPAPTFSCVSYPTCPKFNTPLTSACPANGGMCNSNYFVRCNQELGAGSVLIARFGNALGDGDACRAACDARNNCVAFVYSRGFSSAAPVCDLYSSIAPYNDAFVDTYIRICPSTC